MRPTVPVPHTTAATCLMPGMLNAGAASRLTSVHDQWLYLPGFGVYSPLVMRRLACGMLSACMTYGAKASSSDLRPTPAMASQAYRNSWVSSAGRSEGGGEDGRDGMGDMGRAVAGMVDCLRTGMGRTGEDAPVPGLEDGVSTPLPVYTGLVGWVARMATEDGK